MRNANLKLTFLAACTLAGCSQIIGLSDYDIDPKLGASEGGEGGAPPSTAGTHNTKAGSGGEPGQAGEPGSGGVPATGGKSSGGSAGEVAGVAGAGEAGEAGAAGAPLGQVVPCDSADCCDALGGKAVGVEMLKDGGFEVGTLDDGSPWGEVSTGNYEAVTNDPDFGFKPKTGEYYAYLTGLAAEVTTIYQTFVVPKDAGWLTVSGYRLFQVDTQDDVNMDFCGIGFYSSPAGDLVELPFYWGRPSDSTDGWGDSPTWKYFEKSWDALPHQAQKRELDFRGSSDSYSTDTDVTASSYLFDDLSLKVYRCYK